MSKFIEEFYYGNLDPQARSTKENKTVQIKTKYNYSLNSSADSDIDITNFRHLERHTEPGFHLKQSEKIRLVCCRAKRRQHPIHLGVLLPDGENGLFFCTLINRYRYSFPYIWP